MAQIGTSGLPREIRGSEGDELSGRRIALCVTASISCYRAPDIARLLIRHGADVYPVMTKRSSLLIGPEVMRWATGNEVVTEITGEIEHVKLTEGELRVDAVVVAPATGNTIAKISSGISDSPVTLVAASALGAGIPLILAPAMHESMMRNVFLMEAVERLRSSGVRVIEPRFEEGKAKLSDEQSILDAVIDALTPKLLSGRRFIVTAGPTREYIDDVRFITNASSGMMGIEVARALKHLGGEVSLVLGPSPIEPPSGVRVYRVETADEMTRAVLDEAGKGGVEALFAAAAVSDYRLEGRVRGKIETRDNPTLQLTLTTTPKLVREARRASPAMEIVAFRAAYGGDVDPASQYAAVGREIDAIMLVINDVSRRDIGFGSRHNEATIITRSGRIVKTGLLTKSRLARVVVEEYMREKEATSRGGPGGI